MAYKSTKGIVLKAVNYRDADRIFTLYSESYGKIPAIARGVRRIRSKRGGSLDTLNFVSFTYFEGSTGHRSITEVQVLDSFVRLKSSVERISRAYKILSFMHRRVVDEVPDPRIFWLTQSTLTLLDDLTLSADAPLLYFYVNMLDYLGFRLDLNHCLTCTRPINSTWTKATFDFEHGGLVCPSCNVSGFYNDLPLLDVALLRKVRHLNTDAQKYFMSSTKLNMHMARLVSLLETYMDIKFQ